MNGLTAGVVAGAPAEKQRAFSEILEFNTATLNRAANIESRLRKIAERIFGPEPESDATAEMAPEPSCMLDGFRAINDRTSDALSGAENLITRIEGAV